MKELICPSCDYVSKTNDDINKLYLSIDNDNNDNNNKPMSFDDLINKYLYESLDSDNQWKCDKCNDMVEANIKRTINKFPKYLIVTLKRYANNNKKLGCEIDMPMIFSHPITNKQFHMRGFIYHSGSTGGGHYVYYGNKKDKWYLYNDSSVSNISNEQINNIKKTGYIYLYVSK